MKRGTNCGFCRKSESKVGLIIAEKLGEICCECLSICLEMLFENGTDHKGYTVIDKGIETLERPGYKVKIRRFKDNDCFFCLRKQHQVKMMIKGHDQLICSHCTVHYSRLALSVFGQVSKDMKRKKKFETSSSEPSTSKPS
jgi:ATP-dependent protease Clp ATPase subunit